MVIHSCSLNRRFPNYIINRQISLTCTFFNISFYEAWIVKYVVFTWFISFNNIRDKDKWLPFENVLKVLTILRSVEVKFLVFKSV